MEMRKSRVLKKLRAGEIVRCMKVNLSDAKIPELAALCGFDCVWLDMEHVPLDWAELDSQIRSAKCHDVDTLVRVSRGSYSDYIKPLEADAAGIMVPHVMGLEDAKKVVWQCRFDPIGRRPIDGGNADACYCMIDSVEYARSANEQRFVILQIEDPEPLDELEEIAKLDGIDMLFFGPGDFSHGIGALGQGDHPLITETRKRIAKVARDNGKFAGTVGGLDNLQELVDMGYQFVCVGADIVGLGVYFKEVIAGFEAVEAGFSG